MTRSVEASGSRGKPDLNVLYGWLLEMASESSPYESRVLMQAAVIVAKAVSNSKPPCPECRGRREVLVPCSAGDYYERCPACSGSET